MFNRFTLRAGRLMALGLGVAMLFALAGVGTASAHTILPAHAKVYKAIPAIGSTVNSAPTSVTVFTLENINPDPKKSNLFVYGPSGDLISQGNAKVSLNNPQEMSVTIKPETNSLNGIYVVQWITVSAADGDPDAGAFAFIVNTKAGNPSATATTTSNTTTPSNTTSTEAGGTPVWVPILVGIVALLVGLGGGLALGRRRPATASSIASMRRTIEQSEADEQPAERP